MHCERHMKYKLTDILQHQFTNVQLKCEKSRSVLSLIFKKSGTIWRLLNQCYPSLDVTLLIKKKKEREKNLR